MICTQAIHTVAFQIFIESAALRSIIRSHVKLANTLFHIFIFVFLGDATSPRTVYHYYIIITLSFPFMERVRGTFSFRLVFVYLVTTGWILTSAYIRAFGMTGGMGKRRR